tara:strand:- start:1401 stop:2102 length:702 start_codon:yes stop_codon:yes gene_type:complete
MEQADNVEVAEATEAPVSTRPEWLPEKFESPEAMAKSYGELESWKGKREDDLRSEIISQMEQEAYSNRPATAGDYSMPETVNEELAVDNALFQWWTNHAFENGYSQDEFEDGIKQFNEALEMMQPNLDEEIKSLGDNADARIEAVSLWSQKFFPEEYEDVILGIGQSAKGIEMMEFLMQHVKDASVSNDAGVAPRTTEDDLRTKMQDPRYWNPVKRDQAFVREVDEGFAQLYR